MLNILAGAVAIGGLLLGQVGYDMAVIQKWEAAKVIRYQVVGVHQARTMVVFGDYEGKADVTDTIAVEFVWDKKAGKMVGDVKVTDAKSVLKNIKSDGTNCPPPTLKGDYEEFQYVSQTVERDGQIQLKGKRVFPAAMVSNYPSGCGMRPIPGGQEDTLLTLGAADPGAMGITMPAGSPIKVAADKKSFSMVGGRNWVFTFTPSIVQ